MAFQQSDLDRLDSAIASGVQQVTFADGRSTRYQSLADMVAARKMIAKEVAGAGARASGRRRMTVLQVGRR